jgi:hypothetical protein
MQSTVLKASQKRPEKIQPYAVAIKLQGKQQFHLVAFMSFYIIAAVARSV